MKPIDTQWWVAELDKYGNPTLTDGAHTNKESCEEAIFIMESLIKDKKNRVIVKVEIYPGEASQHNVNVDSLKILKQIMR